MENVVQVVSNKEFIVSRNKEGEIEIVKLKVQGDQRKETLELESKDEIIDISLDDQNYLEVVQLMDEDEFRDKRAD